MALLTVAMATSGGSGTNVQGELSNPVSVPDVTGEVKGDGGRLDQNTESLNVTSLMTSDGESKNDSPPSNESGHSDVKGEVRGALIDQIKKFEQTIQTVEHIPEVLHDVTLECLHVDTLEHLKFFLDPTEDVLTSDNMCKDYRGVAEWAGLQQIFIRYISKVDCSNKISEVISMWIKGEGIQHEATVGNFRKCLIELDRPDVLLEMAVKIAKDAIQWKKRELEIPDEPARPLKDTSWQLTRHDVVTGKPTHYMCCLMYADEDDGMASLITELYRKLVPRAQFFRPQFDLKHGAYEMAATAEVIDTRCNGKVIFLISEYFYASAVCRFVVSYCKHVDTTIRGKKTMYTACLVFADDDYCMAKMIINLYRSVHKQALFFCPQFDLKMGKYELDNTAKVIDERCDRKVIFLLSEYFFASEVCQFAVSYCAAHGTGGGNLIPFHLTRDLKHVPAVLRGIAGIRWFRPCTRSNAWDMLTDSLMAHEPQLNAIKVKIEKMVNDNTSYYLGDPPYDVDVQPAGEPIKVVEPPSASGMSSLPSDFDNPLIEIPTKTNTSSSCSDEPVSKLAKIKRKILTLVFGTRSTESKTIYGRSPPEKVAEMQPMSRGSSPSEHSSDPCGNKERNSNSYSSTDSTSTQSGARPKQYPQRCSSGNCIPANTSETDMINETGGESHAPLVPSEHDELSGDVNDCTSLEHGGRFITCPETMSTEVPQQKSRQHDNNADDESTDDNTDPECVETGVDVLQLMTSESQDHALVSPAGHFGEDSTSGHDRHTNTDEASEREHILMSELDVSGSVEEGESGKILESHPLM